MQSLTFITGNQAKAEQLARHLDYPISHKNIDLTEIQSLDLKEIARHKAQEAFQQMKTPVLIEDSSLQFAALGRLPGPYIKWFLHEIGPEGLCQLLNAFADRSAVSEVNYALHDGKEIHIFTATMHGTIATSPRGTRGFGFDRIFINEGFTKTRGEMTLEEYAETSARRRAIEKLSAYLNKKRVST